MNNQGVYSPLSGSQATASVNSPMSTTLSPLQGNEFLTLNDTTGTIFFMIYDFLFLHKGTEKYIIALFKLLESHL